MSCRRSFDIDLAAFLRDPHARELAEKLQLTDGERALLLETAAWHDWGKAHQAFVAKAQPVAGGPPPGAAVALPRCRVMAHRDQPDRPFPPQADLTK